MPYNTTYNTYYKHRYTVYNTISLVLYIERERESVCVCVYIYM